MLEEFRGGLFDFEQLNSLIEYSSPVKSLIIYRGFSKWSACETIDLNSRDYLGHCLEHHRGITMKNSQSNRPLGWTGLIIMMIR